MNGLTLNVNNKQLQQIKAYFKYTSWVAISNFFQTFLYFLIVPTTIFTAAYLINDIDFNFNQIWTNLVIINAIIFLLNLLVTTNLLRLAKQFSFRQIEDQILILNKIDPNEYPIYHFKTLPYLYYLLLLTIILFTIGYAFKTNWINDRFNEQAKTLQFVTIALNCTKLIINCSQLQHSYRIRI